MNDWTELAACRGRDQRLWFPRKGDWFAIQVAKTICATCPVRADCLAEALTARSAYPAKGIWGGLTEVERQRLSRQHAS